MQKYTVIYMQPAYRITSYRYINCKSGEFETELAKQGIDMSQVRLVFHGHLAPVGSDWSLL